MPMESTEKLRQVLVAGMSTDWLMIEPKEKYDEIILFMPGNPSLINFYKQFCRELFILYGGKKAIWSFTMGDQAASGHSIAETLLCANNTPSLEHQMKHKAEFMATYLPEGVKVIVIGYSIACYLLIRLIKQNTVAIQASGNNNNDTQKNNNSDICVHSMYFIFPTIERMGESPLGRIFLPVLCYFTWLILAFFYIVLIFPFSIKFPVIKILLRSFEGKPPQDEFVRGAIEMIHPIMLKRVLNTLQEELEIVRELDIETIQQNSEGITFYYGSYDPLCPQKYLFELKEQLPAVQGFLCQDSLHHVYVTHTSRQMAQICRNMMENGNAH